MVSGPPGSSMLPTKWSRDAPEKFKGHYSKIKELIHHYEQLLAQCQITTEKEKCKGITTYCSSEVTWLIESLDKYRTPNWDDLKGRLLHLYDAEWDEAQYQLGNLDRLVHRYAKKTLWTLSDWKTYIWKFIVIAQWLKAEHVIQDVDCKTSFWLGIPEVMQSKVETHLSWQHNQGCDWTFYCKGNQYNSRAIATVKTGFTLRMNSKNWSYLVMFGTWLHHMWCALVSVVLGVSELIKGFGKIGGPWLSCKANRRVIEMRRSLRGGMEGWRES